jgi:hypothetical protein
VDSWGAYLLSLPERAVRTAVAVSAGAVREIGEIAVPGRVRRGRLYDNLVGATLRYCIEQVGGVEGAYPAEDALTSDFLARRAAGNAVELLGVVAFHASPVWVLAALADLCGAGRQIIPEIAAELEAKGLLEPGATFTSVDELLDGLERASGRLAATVNAPPLDVASLREEWRELTRLARAIPAGRFPARTTVTGLWRAMADEARRQERSVFEISSTAAVAAAWRLPEAVRWLSASAVAAAGRTGRVVATALLDDYRRTLDAIREEGYATHAARVCRPYVRAALAQFRPGRRTLTERWLAHLRARR